MPELPEVERARTVIEGHALHRRITEVDDTDTFVCRPHPPGEIRSALLGRTLLTADRRGKTMWCRTSAVGADQEQESYEVLDEGPHLGLHLGMGGVIVVTEPGGRENHGGDPFPRNGAQQADRWNRFTLIFADGGSLVLFDKRRLGRVRLEPDLSALGQDAQFLPAKDFYVAVLGPRKASKAPIKVRIMDQAVLAGVGNLLADEALWQARINPATSVDALDRRALNRLHAAVVAAIAVGVEKGGVHMGTVIPARRKGGVCPRCGAPMEHGTVGGRSTWWCTREQQRKVRVLA